MVGHTSGLITPGEPIAGPGVINAGTMGEPHERIVAVHLPIVAVRGSFRNSVQSASDQMERSIGVLDQRHRRGGASDRGDIAPSVAVQISHGEVVDGVA